MKQGFGLALIVLMCIFPSLATAQLVKPQILLPVSKPAAVANEPLGATGSLDLIVEASTYVPYFYEGRREPSPGSQVRLTAVLPLGSKPASFRWQVGTQNTISTSPTITFIMPQFGGELRTTVTAVDGAGRSLGSANETITATHPGVLFYEINKIRGLSAQALGTELTLIGDEISIKAEPYFFASGLTLENVQGEWSGRDIEIIGNREDWREVALRRASSTAEQARVELEVKSTSNLVQTLTGSFNVLGL